MRYRLPRAGQLTESPVFELTATIFWPFTASHVGRLNVRAAVMAPLFGGTGEQPAFAADYRNRDNGLIYEVNTKEWAEGKKLNFSRADAIDTAIFNKFLWQDRMGSIAMPAPHHGVFPASDPLEPSKRDLD